MLTLWAAVVAERLGFDWQEALTLGRAVAGLNAYSKGKALGLFEPTPEAVREKRDQLRRQKGAFSIDLLNRKVLAVHTEAGIRALQKDQPTNPASVMDYLERTFGDAFDDARNAMALLAGAHEPQELAAAGYRLYEGRKGLLRPRSDSSDGKRGPVKPGEALKAQIGISAPFPNVPHNRKSVVIGMLVADWR